MEGAYPKAGNVYPTNPSNFQYFDLLMEAYRLKEVCEMKLPLGERFLAFIPNQRKSALTGFAILTIPLFNCLDEGLEMGKCGLREVKESTPEDAYLFLKSLKLSKLTHLKKIEAREYPDVSRPEIALEKGWNLYDVLERMGDTISREILSGYPISIKGARYLIRRGFEEIPKLQGLILSEVLDDLVARKWGLKVAYNLTLLARKGLHEEYIRELNLNPGTTADLIGTSILIAVSELMKEGIVK